MGENGSGKSIFLSHIVNGLLSAKDRIYPDAREVELGKVFKLRSGSYIRHGSDAYFARVSYEGDLYMGELRSRHSKQDYNTMPQELSLAASGPAEWNQMENTTNDHHFENISAVSTDTLRRMMTTNALLYFPHDRYEEPAWLNQTNLTANAEHMIVPHLQGHTNRRLINYSPLQSNQNWLFDVAYDRAAFEASTKQFPIRISDSEQTINLPVHAGYSGTATNVFNIALEVVQKVMRNNPRAEFRIGQRLARVVSLVSSQGTIVSNIFHLSSGETALLNLFLSILRDFDLTRNSFNNAASIRGVVIVDEVDLHLHTVHQHEVLPSLIQMFPKVQFIVTTHSPLFVLGMSRAFGEDGFALYRLPQGLQISPEEFTEFGAAYQTFRQTSRFSDDVRQAVKDTERPIVYVEGITDIQYVGRAADLLGRTELLDGVDLKDGQGGLLDKTWEAICKVPEELVPRPVIVLRDCDYNKPPDNKEKRYRRTIPARQHHPIKKGIENLFGQGTIERVRAHKTAFVDVKGQQLVTTRGEEQVIPEQWSINENEKRKLCDWLCQNGTAEDFRHFEIVFDLLENLLEQEQASSS